MKPCALCLWTGSELPGGYSTVNMNTSFPGNSGRGLVISGVTTGSAAYTAVTPSSRDNRRADFIFFPLWVASSGRVVAKDKRVAAGDRQRDPRWRRGAARTHRRRPRRRGRGAAGAWSVPSPPMVDTIADVLGYTRCRPRHRAGDARREGRPANPRAARRPRSFAWPHASLLRLSR